MFRWVAALSLCSTLALAGSVSNYSGCKSLGAEREACMKCVGSGAFYQPGQGCGMVKGMHKSKSVGTEKPPPRPAAMPKTGKDWVTVPAGTFEIGARESDPDKDDGREVFDAKVTLTHAFEMKTTEVTQGEYLFVTGQVTPFYDKKCGLECPATGVSWNEAVAYLNALSKREKLEPCYEVKDGLATWTRGFECTGYRLPTEAEWEWAARGGSEEPRYGEPKAIAWFYDNSDGTPHPVGKKQKNAYGLFDMLGNAWEWAFDASEYKPYEGEMTDPIIGGLTQEAGKDRCMRGGSFSDNVLSIRAQIRFQYLPGSASNNHGFRPVRTVKKKD